MLSAGSQRTLARVSSASATQTLAWAAATISGRASESRRAVARLIGKRRSVGSTGAGFSVNPVARGLGSLALASPAMREEAGAESNGVGKAGGKSPRSLPSRELIDGGEVVVGKGGGTCWPPCLVTGTTSGGGRGKLRALCLVKRSMAGDTVDGSKSAWCSLAEGFGLAVGEAARCARGAGLIVAVDDAGGWAAHGAGATQGNSRVVARIDGQAVLSFIINPTPSTSLSMRSGPCALPADSAARTRAPYEHVKLRVD